MPTYDKHFISREVLTTRDQALRKNLEREILEAETHYYINQGKALQVICRKRLYRSTHSTFAEYTQGVLDITARRAYQLITSIDVVDNLKFQAWFVKNFSQTKTQRPVITLPTNEAIARAFAILKPEKLLEAFEMAVEIAPDGKMTAAHANTVARAFRDKTTLDSIKSVQDKVHKGDMEESQKDSDTGKNSASTPTTPRIALGFKRKFEGLLSEIRAELKKGWRTTDRSEVLKHLDAIRVTLIETTSHKTPETIFLPEQDNADKLITGGFEVYRVNKEACCLERYHSGHGWLLHKECQDADAMKLEFDEILTDSMKLRG